MSRPRRALLTALRAIVAVLLVCGAVRVGCFTVFRVAGTSMLDTLHHDDRILVCDLPWLARHPRAGDIVVLEVEGEVLVKRVAACPGDAIALYAGQLVRNGRRVPERIPEAYRRPDSMIEYGLGDDEYFVLGDHRRVSIDSRDFGPVHRRQLVGRVLFRLTGGGLDAVAALERSD